MGVWGPCEKPTRKLWDTNATAWWAEWVGGWLCCLLRGKQAFLAAGYPEERRPQRGTCWNFFLDVPVSRSCGSIWGGGGGRLAQIYMPGLCLALTLLFRLGFFQLESFVTKCNGYRPRSRFQLLVTM